MQAHEIAAERLRRGRGQSREDDRGAKGVELGVARGAGDRGAALGLRIAVIDQPGGAGDQRPQVEHVAAGRLDQGAPVDRRFLLDQRRLEEDLVADVVLALGQPLERRLGQVRDMRAGAAEAAALVMGMGLLALVRLIAIDHLPVDGAALELGQIEAEDLLQRGLGDLAHLVGVGDLVGILDLDLGMHRGLHRGHVHRTGVDLHPHRGVEHVEPQHRLLVDHHLGPGDVLLALEGDHRPGAADRLLVVPEIGVDPRRAQVHLGLVLADELVGDLLGGCPGDARGAFLGRAVAEENHFAVFVPDNVFGHSDLP